MEVNGMLSMATIIACFVLTPLSAMGQKMTEDEAADLAKQTLAAELEVEENVLELVSTEQVQWPNSALGCPEKGRSYLQVMTPGYRVSFRHNDQIYRVNVGNRRAVYCKGGAKKPGFEKNEGIGPALRISQLAQQDLVSRLGIDVSRVKIKFVKPTVWPDTGLGCPEEGKDYEKVETAGYLVELEVDGETYEYHADNTKPRLCEKP
jgi:hypothetical protein